MEQTLRQKAIAWWNQLPAKANDNFISKRFFFERYENQRFTPALNYTELTGIEIQSIYEAEHPTNSEAKNYVGVRFKHKESSSFYTVKNIHGERMTISTIVHPDLESFTDMTLEKFERNIKSGEWVIVPESEILPVHKSIDENGDLLPKESSNISPLEETGRKQYDNAGFSDDDGGLNLYMSGVRFAEHWMKENTPKPYSEDEVLKILDTFNRSTLKLQEYKLGNSYYVKDWWEDFKQQTK